MRKRRVALLVLTILLFAGVVSGAVYQRQRVLDQHAEDARARGLEALEKGDYSTALDQIGRYLQRFGQEEDAEALVAYAKARKRVPIPNNRHLQQAIGLFLSSLELRPGNLEARRELLDIYTSIGYGREALDLAADILEEKPNDIQALRAEALAFTRLRSFDEALGRAARIAELAPLDIENHMLALALRVQAGMPKEDLLGYPRSQSALDPQESHFQLLQAAVYELTGDRKAAAEWAERAAENAPTDAGFVSLLDASLVRLGRFDASLELLERAAVMTGDLQTKRSLIYRLFQAGDLQLVVELAGDVPIELQDSEILAILAMTHASLDEVSVVEAIVAELERRENEALAGAWAPLLRSIWLNPEQRAQDLVAACREAIVKDEKDPYFHFFLGLAYERLGEREQAIRSWRNASRLEPTWFEPFLRSARLLVSMGETKDASRFALEALRRSHRSMAVAAAAAEIIGMDVGGLSSNDRQQLYVLVKTIRTQNPEEPLTLPLFIELLARDGDVEAAEASLRRALAQSEIPERTALKLARVSNKYELGLADACYETFVNSKGVTPAIAYARAEATHKKGEGKRGLELLTEYAGSRGDEPKWQVAIARYLELIGDESAVSAWAKIGDSEMADPAIQRRILNSPVAWSDLALIERTISRLRDMTGEEGLNWRAAQARWLLDSSSGEKAAAEAATLLNDVIHSSSIRQAKHYVLMASALSRLNNMEGAIDNLTLAADLSPESTEIRLELARLHQERGNTGRASLYLNDILNDDAKSAAEIRRVAALLARQNEIDRAVALLLGSYPPDEREQPADLLLAQLYRRSGLLEKAEIICNKLLEENLTPLVIEFAADLLASQGREKEALAILGRLDELDLQPGMRQLLLAEHHRYHGSPVEAQRLYESAISAAAADPTIWRRHLAFLFRTGQGDRAIDLFDDAYEACPGEELFQKLLAYRGRVKEIATERLAQRFILAAIEAPERINEAIEALELFHESSHDPVRLAIQLRRLSVRYPRFLPLKMQIVRLYGTLARHEDAAAVASQAMRDFPYEVEPAWLASEMLAASAASYGAKGAASSRWLAALEAAKEWRRRSYTSAAAADLLIAAAYIRLNRSSEALATIRPYIDEIALDPSAYTSALVLYARALIGDDQFEEASDFIGPRLQVSSEWRKEWTRLAAQEVPVEAAIEWIDRVSLLIPDDSIDERLALAAAWHNIAARTGGVAYRDATRTILEALISRPDVTGRTVLALAILADEDKNYAEAESGYRLALRLDPGLAIANNNLTMLLINRNEDLPEALVLAEAAVQSDPEDANFHDTLAQANAALGNLDVAIQNITKATELEPRVSKWRNRLRALNQQRRRME